MSSYSQEEFYQEDSNVPTVIDEKDSVPTISQTPNFCKRISMEEIESNAKTTTHKELLKMGALMNKPNVSAPSDIFKIKTMSLKELDEYVENKLSKDHYSPEVIYLLFKIQTLLLEKEHMNRRLTENDGNINKLQKELLDEKTLTMDLKDSMKESVGEIDSNEKEYKIESALSNEKYRVLSQLNDKTLTRKNQYETVLFYIGPITMVWISIFINYMYTIISKFILSA